MKTNYLSLLTVLAVLAAYLGISPVVHAQAARTWVSGVGDDANPFSRTAPGKTINIALTKTALGGEIDALDPSNFGPFTNTHAITIDGKGPLSAIAATNGTAIQVNAAATDVVTFRNLSITGATNGTYGVQILGAGVVRLENCVIFGGSANGVDFQPTTLNTKLYIINCHIYNAGGTGVFVNPASGGTVVIENSIIEQCAIGINAAAGTVMLVNSSVVGNTGAGLATSGTGAIKTFHNNFIAGNNPDGSPTGSLPMR